MFSEDLDTWVQVYVSSKDLRLGPHTFFEDLTPDMYMLSEDMDMFSNTWDLDCGLLQSV